ncbi:MAG: hypothetical protein HGA53_04860, partial [Anaerolineaceae bacterium]|nr:hypothetical protein [Anaerolineaceae bacterium]
MEIEILHDGFRLSCEGVELLRHTSEQPFISLTQADFHFSSKNGQHLVKNRLANWIPLTGYELGDGWARFFNGEVEVKTQLTEEDQGVRIDLCLPEGFNFACLRLPASAEEAVYGGGMQFSHLNLRGKQFPIWTCEAGVGRNKRYLATILADLVAGAGGNYWTTYNPQPVFLTSRGSGYLLDSDSYSCLDFRGRDAYKIEFLGNASLHCFAASNLAGLVGKVAQHSGIQPAPPDWVFEGGILGIQGGLDFVRDTLDQLREAGAALTGVWTQDWQGIRMTPTGKRLFWNWQADDSLYPQLSEEIEKQLQLNTRWLGYLNPYFNSEGEQYKIAHNRGYLV